MRLQFSIALFALCWATISSALHVDIVKRDPESSLGVSNPRELTPMPVDQDLIKTVAVVAEAEPTTKATGVQPTVVVDSTIVHAPKREGPVLDPFDFPDFEAEPTLTIEQIYFSDPNYVHIGGGPPRKGIDYWNAPYLGNGINEIDLGGIIYDILDIGPMYLELQKRLKDNPRIPKLKDAEELYALRGKLNDDVMELLKNRRIHTSVGTPDFLNPFHPSYEQAKRMVADGLAITDIPDMIAVH